MAEFTASYACTEVEVTDGDAVVLDMICEIIISLRHGTNENCNALTLPEPSNVVADTYNFRIEAECNFAAVWRKVVGDGIFDDFN